MLYRTVPKNNDKLSILGFGCMRFPMNGQVIDEQRAIKQIRYAIDKGVNYVDTAWPYHGGASETILGQALGDGYREKVKLATKLPSWMIKKRADMDTYLNAQLKKLGTDHIDYYLVHALYGSLWDQLNSMDVLEFLETAKKDGRIVNAGFSFHGLLPDFKRIIDAYQWTFCQIQYNYLDQNYQAGTEGLNYAADRDIAVIVMEPLRGGNLARPEPPSPIKDIWAESPVRRSPAEWALRWVWNHPGVTVVLSGMNEESQIDENLKIAGESMPESLTEAELLLIERVRVKYGQLMRVNCTGCAYCMPCPSKVAIPMCFEQHNKTHMFSNLEEGRFVYALRLSGELGDGKPGFASQCTRCGACLKKCPQHIPIPDILKEIADEMEDSKLQERIAQARIIFKAKAK